MSKITVLRLKQYLKKFSEDDLSKEIIELFQKFDQVKEFYQSKLVSGGGFELHKKYKKIIKDEFFPSRGLSKMRLSVAKKAIADFKKLNNNPNLIIDLMIYYVEIGVDFTGEYGDIDEPFYYSMESMYDAAAKFAIENKIANHYISRFKEIVDDTRDMGWGFYGSLKEMYDEYFSKYDRPTEK